MDLYWWICAGGFVLVELLSPGTEGEDLAEAEIGGNGRTTPQPPRKWDVGERIIPLLHALVVFCDWHEKPMTNDQ